MHVVHRSLARIDETDLFLVFDCTSESKTNDNDYHHEISQLRYVSNVARGNDMDTRAVISREFVKSLRSLRSSLTTGGIANWMQDTKLRFTGTNPLISSSTDGLARANPVVSHEREDFSRRH